MANSVDPDQTPQNVASDLGLHCLQRPICPNSWCYNGNIGNKVDLIIECIFFFFFFNQFCSQTYSATISESQFCKMDH